MEKQTFVCITPEKLLGEAKSSDKIQGFVQDNIFFSSMYVSDLKAAKNLIFSRYVVILMYFPIEKQSEQYLRAARKFVREISENQNFQLISDDSSLKKFAPMRMHKLLAGIPPADYLLSVAKMHVKQARLAM